MCHEKISMCSKFVNQVKNLFFDLLMYFHLIGSDRRSGIFKILKSTQIVNIKVTHALFVMEPTNDLNSLRSLGHYVKFKI